MEGTTGLLWKGKQAGLEVVGLGAENGDRMDGVCDRHEGGIGMSLGIRTESSLETRLAWGLGGMWEWRGRWGWGGKGV